MLQNKYSIWVLCVALVCWAEMAAGEPSNELPAVSLTDSTGSEPAVLTPQQTEPQLISPAPLLDW